MRNRRDELDALRTGFACEMSWEQMDGEGCRRFCAACQRPVLDLAQMTPAAIRGHLQASRGDLCGRLTRSGGRLVVATAPTPAGWERERPPRRVHAVAAGLVAAWLSAAAAEAAEREPAAAVETQPGADRTEPASRAAQSLVPGALGGIVADDQGGPLPGVSVLLRSSTDGREQATVTDAHGAYEFSALAAGPYRLVATLEGFLTVDYDGITVTTGRRVQADVTMQFGGESVTTGAMVVVAQPLRVAFDNSDLVVVAVAGRSRVVERDGDMAEVMTELRSRERGQGHGATPVASSPHRVRRQRGCAARARRPRRGTRVLGLPRAQRRRGDGAADTFEAVDFRHQAARRRSARRLSRASRGAATRRAARRAA